MNIAIDITPCFSQKAGIGHYTTELVKAIVRNKKEHKIFLLTHSSDFPTELKELDAETILIKSSRVNFFWILKAIFVLKRFKIDRFLSTSNFTFAIFLKNSVQIVHDVAPLRFPEFFTKKGVFMYKLQLNLLARKKRRIFVTSSFIKNEIQGLFKNKMRISKIGIGIKNTSSESYRPKIKLPDKYILSIGTLEPRKNYENMLKAFSIFEKENPEFSYLIIGKKGWLFEPIFKQLEVLENKEKVKFQGYVSDLDLNHAIKKSKGVMMMSYYEGIGMPPLEAYSKGIPVLVSRIPVFKEIFNEYKNGVFYADPYNPQEIAIQIQKLVNSEKIDSVTVNNFLASFTWDNVGKKALEKLLQI